MFEQAARALPVDSPDLPWKLPGVFLGGEGGGGAESSVTYGKKLLGEAGEAGASRYRDLRRACQHKL